jgi:hypothetical protein
MFPKASPTATETTIESTRKATIVTTISAMRDARPPDEVRLEYLLSLTRLPMLCSFNNHSVFIKEMTADIR